MQPKHFYDVPLTEVYCKIKLCVSILVYVSVNVGAYSKTSRDTTPWDTNLAGTRF